MFFFVYVKRRRVDFKNCSLIRDVCRWRRYAARIRMRKVARINVGFGRIWIEKALPGTVI